MAVNLEKKLETTIKSKKSVKFRINGVAPGFLREYGCYSCPQCSSLKPQAHISASLLIRDSWENQRKIGNHILFDCGIGAIDSLIDIGAPWVNYLFISHGHPYHSLGLDRLVWGQKRHDGPLPIKIYCTSETYNQGPHRIYPWFFKDKQLLHEPVEPLKSVSLDLGIDLKITPVSVYQGDSAPNATIYVVDFGDKKSNTYHKIVLGWEFVHFIPRFAEEDKDPSYKGEIRQDTMTQRYGELFQNVDDLFFDGNTVYLNSHTHHMSIDTGLRFLIPEIKPKRTWIVHYSGHEDPSGPLSDEQLQDWVNNRKKYYGLNDSCIRIGEHGMFLVYDV